MSYHFIKEFTKSFSVFLVFEPQCMKIKSKWSTICVIVPPEVMHKHLIQLILREVRWTGVNHGTAELLHNNLIQGHLPDAGE